jgi:porin
MGSARRLVPPQGLCGKEPGRETFNSNSRHRREPAVLIVVLAIALNIAIPAMAQDEPTPSRDPTTPAKDMEASDHYSLRCPAPANPKNLHFECVGAPFDAIKETLTKDLASYRTELAKLGITAIHSYTAQFMGNPSGGKSQGFTYAGTLQDLVSWNLYKFMGVPGLSFNIGASYASGRNLSAEYVGNVFTVQSAFNGKGNVNLQQMYLQQQFLDGALTIALGRLAPANTFATLPVFSNYMNGGINSFPGSLNINDSTFTASPPGVQWGAQTLYNVTPSIQVAAGIYNTNPFAAAGNNNGVNFAFQQGNSGALTVTQVSYLHNQARGDVGMPGEYTLGGTYDSNTFSSLSSPAVAERGSYSLYALFQQMAYRDGEPGSLKGLTVWGEAAISPKPSVSSMPYFLGGGISYQGVIPSREKDIASAGVIYGSFSGYIPQTSCEAAIEANYRIAITPWLSIMPDVQYIVKPGGNSNIHNAVVLGAQLDVTF